MTHRIYLRWQGQRTSDKTTSESSSVARFALDELKARADLLGQDVAAVWTCDGKQLAYHDFSSRLPSIAAALVGQVRITRKPVAATDAGNQNDRELEK